MSEEFRRRYPRRRRANKYEQFLSPGVHLKRSVRRSSRRRPRRR